MILCVTGDCLNTCFVIPSCKAVTVHRTSEKLECLYSIPKVPSTLTYNEQSITYCKQECTYNIFFHKILAIYSLVIDTKDPEGMNIVLEEWSSLEKN